LPCFASRQRGERRAGAHRGTIRANRPRQEAYMGNLLWLIILILVIMWLGGFAFHVGGSLIHLLIVVAVIILIVQLLSGRRRL
jgi:hypothetical protein